MRPPRITVSTCVSGPTTEAGGTATFTVVLNDVSRRQIRDDRTDVE